MRTYNITEAQFKKLVEGSPYKLVEKTEEDLQMDRINAFLKRNRLTIEDLKKILLLTMGGENS